MAVNTYFGSGKMTAIYKGAVEITKVYLGANLVYSTVVPPTPTAEVNYYVGEGVGKKFNNNTPNYYVGEAIQQM